MAAAERTPADGVPEVTSHTSGLAGRRRRASADRDLDLVDANNNPFVPDISVALTSLDIG